MWRVASGLGPSTAAVKPKSKKTTGGEFRVWVVRDLEGLYKGSYKEAEGVLLRWGV